MSKIEWTEKTWNPVSGCTKVSEGCRNCYAETMSKRLQAMGTPGYGNGFQLTLQPSRLKAPLQRKKPTMYFVNSMSDLFHEDVPFDYIDKVFAVMALCPQHTFQVLTKRPERMAEYFARAGLAENIAWVANYKILKKSHYGSIVVLPLTNVWLGTSVEDQQTADERIPHLLQTPASLRFISCEPLLGPVDLQFGKSDRTCHMLERSKSFPFVKHSGVKESLIGWVICGGESGANARPMHPDWARSLRDQCKEAYVPFFFKQWGEWQDGSSLGRHNEIILNDGQHGCLPSDCGYKSSDCDSKWNSKNPVRMSRVGKAKAGRLLDGVLHDAFPKGKTK